MRRYAQYIEAAGGGGLYWGFVDETARRTYRPGRLQAAAYNGHKKAHCFRFLCVATPDGLLASAAGPFAGRSNKNQMLRDFDLEARLN